MEIRHAQMEELSRIMEIYAQARSFMVRTGNPRQWAARGWPPDEKIRDDIARGNCYVCLDEGQPVAVFYYACGQDPEPLYRGIRGQWQFDGPYGVVHRLAALEGRGAGKVCLRWAVAQAGHLRIDTHPDNRVMQRILESMGFARRGTVGAEGDNDPRIAYEI